MKNRFLFPALRCRMGEWIYYVTYFTFRDVVQWVKPTEEVHKSRRLAEWIQRQLDQKHSRGIADYLKAQPERFFNAIVIGVYGGEPQWAPLKLSVPIGSDIDHLVQDEEDLQDSVGLLRLSGNEKLFAIDGQHRVAGIKEVLKDEQSALDREEICTIFVGHENTPAGMERTRRLFTTLNKTAKRVSPADIVALEEDDGFAVVTRRLIDEHPVFAEGSRVAFTPSPAIPTYDHRSITNVLGIYYIAQDLYQKRNLRGRPKKSEVLRTRPSDDFLDKIYRMNSAYWTLLQESVPECREAFGKGGTLPGKFRSKGNNHLLFRPIGQRAFASAVELLMSRKGKSMKASVELLSKADLWLNHEIWHHILWNPLQDQMITVNRIPAETFLLSQIGEKGRSPRNDKRLKELLEKRDRQT